FRASQQLRELLETRSYGRFRQSAKWEGFLQDQIKLMRDRGELDVDFRVAALRVIAEDKPEVLLRALIESLRSNEADLEALRHDPHGRQVRDSQVRDALALIRAAKDALAATHKSRGKPTNPTLGSADT